MSKNDAKIVREQWLNQMAGVMRLELFRPLGVKVPEKLRMSVGWPTRKGKGAHAIGQCFTPDVSRDGTTEIFISPALGDPVEVAATTIHELIHASVGIPAGHKKPFRDVALKMGLEGPMTATTAGKELVGKIKVMLTALPKFPHAALDLSMMLGEGGSGPKKQGTRLLKAECNSCGFVFRVTAKWVDSPGLPTCNCGGEFLCPDAGEDGEDGDE